MNAAARDRLLFASALVVGLAAWWGTAALSGRREAWDAPLFWSLGLPAAYAACLVLGYAGSRGAWRWPALVFGALAAAAVVGSGGSLSLWPLTLLLVGLMTAVGFIPTFIGVGLRRIVDGRRARRAAALARLRAFETGDPAPTTARGETPPAPRS